MTRAEAAEAEERLRHKQSARERYLRNVDEERAKGRERYAERKRDLALTGLCVKCGKFPAVKGKTMCAECEKKNVEAAKRNREKNSANARKRHEKLHSAGLCACCGKNPCAKGKNGRKLAYCEECRAKDAEKHREKRKEMVEKGICTRCGRAPAREGKQMCFDCARIVAEQQRRRKHGEECPKKFDGEEFYLGEPSPAKCLACEIPEKYCMGERCVIAYRRWKKSEWIKCKNTEVKK